MGIKTTCEAACVSRRPTFLSCFPSTMTHHVDDTIELSCSFDGSPRPEIFWYFNHQPITSSHPRIKFLDGNRKLRFRRLTSDDAGVYSCLVKNYAGEIENSCTLVVERNPVAKMPEILQQPDDVTCASGDDVVIACRSSFVASVGCFFVWQKDGQPVDASENVKYEREMINSDSMWVKLAISNVQKEDAGRYVLVSMNFFGNAESKESIVTVV